MSVPISLSISYAILPLLHEAEPMSKTTRNPPKSNRLTIFAVLKQQRFSFS